MKIRRDQSTGEEGYILLSVMLFMTLILIALTVQLPRVAQEIKRDKEQELINRGGEYRNAIRKYFRKFGNYPVSVDQLVNTNNMRFLRKKYQDPFTGKDDWHILHYGDIQLNLATGGVNTTGQPSGQIGSNIGQPSGQFGSSIGPTSQFGSNSGSQFGTMAPTSQPGGIGQPVAGAGVQQNQPGQPVTDPNAANASGGSSGTNSSGITAASNLPGASNSPVIGGGPMIGVASTSKLQSIKVRDGKDHYNDWPFYYDPRNDTNTGAGLATAGVNSVGGANPAGGLNPGMGPNQGPGTTPGSSPPMGPPKISN